MFGPRLLGGCVMPKLVLEGLNGSAGRLIALLQVVANFRIRCVVQVESQQRRAGPRKCPSAALILFLARVRTSENSSVFVVPSTTSLGAYRCARLSRPATDRYSWCGTGIRRPRSCPWRTVCRRSANCRRRIGPAQCRWGRSSSAAQWPVDRWLVAKRFASDRTADKDWFLP